MVGINRIKLSTKEKDANNQRAMMLIQLITMNTLKRPFTFRFGSSVTNVLTPVALSYSLSLKSNKMQMGKMRLNLLRKNNAYAGSQGFSKMKKGSADVIYVHISASNIVLPRMNLLNAIKGLKGNFGAVYINVKKTAGNIHFI